MMQNFIAETVSDTMLMDFLFFFGCHSSICQIHHANNAYDNDCAGLFSFILLCRPRPNCSVEMMMIVIGQYCHSVILFNFHSVSA